MTDEGPPPPKRVKLSKGDLENLTKEELLEKWHEREAVLEALMSKQSNHIGDNTDEQEKVKQQQLEATRRENVLVMRLTTKEQEMQEYMNQIAELKQSNSTSTAQLRSMLLDPAINLMFQRMKKEMDACKEKLEQAQNDLAAWKFTPDSQTGKRLMAKCRMLLQENEELGKVISSGRTAKLEGEIALEKTLVGEMKKGQTEMDEFLIELDEDVEGMQSTIYFLQQQLKDSKEQLSSLQSENEQLKARCEALSSSSTGSVGAITTSSGDNSDNTTGVGSPSRSKTRTSPQPAILPPQQQIAVPQDAATSKRTAPPSMADHSAPSSSGGGRTEGTHGSHNMSPTEEGVSTTTNRQLVSNYSLSQNHTSSASSSSSTSASAQAESLAASTKNETPSNNSAGGSNSTSYKGHVLSANINNNAVATNGAHWGQHGGRSQADSDLADSRHASKQTGLSSSSDAEHDGEDNEGDSQSESALQTPHFRHSHQQKEHNKHGPAGAGGRYSNTAGANCADNTDATSSDGWSPSASKHSGSVGQVDDGDGSSSPSEGSASNDAKAGPETLHNGMVSGSGTPGYDSQGDEET